MAERYKYGPQSLDLDLQWRRLTFWITGFIALSPCAGEFFRTTPVLTDRRCHIGH